MIFGVERMFDRKKAEIILEGGGRWDIEFWSTGELQLNFYGVEIRAIIWINVQVLTIIILYFL